MSKTAREIQAEAKRAQAIADELHRQASAAAIAEAEARRPKMPEILLRGTAVVTFERYLNGRIYAYAAIGWRPSIANVRWAVTGSETGRYTWNGLLAFIGEANWSTISEVIATRPVLPAGAEPPVRERMGRYGSVLGTETVVDGSTDVAEGGPYL